MAGGVGINKLDRTKNELGGKKRLCLGLYRFFETIREEFRDHSG